MADSYFEFCLITCVLMITSQQSVIGQIPGKWSRFMKHGHIFDIGNQYNSLLETFANITFSECAQVTAANPHRLWFVYNAVRKGCVTSLCWDIPTQDDINSNSVLFRKQGASGLKSCSDVKAASPNAEDGEYWIYPDAPTFHGCPVKIYCHGMNTQIPSEYVSLLVSNIGVYPNKSNNGCLDEKPYLILSGVGRAGTTVFNKISININTMKVKGSDYTFATVNGAQHPYAQAADCYNSPSNFQCGPVGTFHINTEGTGLIVSNQQTWSGYGFAPFAPNVTRSADGREVHLLCGGWCGGCIPDGGCQLHRDPQEDSPPE